MKVLLVATNRERSPYPGGAGGGCCVAAAARAAGHEVDFLDLGLSLAPQRTLRKALEAARAYQAVAFGIRNLDNCWAFAPRLYFDGVRELAETVRRCFKGPLILGGSGFSVSPHGWMRRLGADCGVIGEGERAFPEVLARLETGRSLEGVDGVITAPNLNHSASVLPRQVNRTSERVGAASPRVVRLRAVCEAGRVRRCADQAWMSFQVHLLCLPAIGGATLPAASAGGGGGRD